VSWGMLYGIGVGPGDPELLTRKAFRLLATVPVIFYPTCDAKEEGFALDIVRRAFEAEEHSGGPNSSPVLARCRPLSTTMARGADVERPHWAEAAEVVGQVLRNGLDAAFITEGDPLLYSTFIHLRLALADRFPKAAVQVVPGVSSVTAAAARVVFPLAIADERVAILPATYDPEYLHQTLHAFDTVVLLKVGRVLDRIIAILETSGLLRSAVLIERCGTSSERIVHDLTSLRGQRVNYFSLILVRNCQGMT
jgi:precorrin-2/cobalt-factor-2 C20-methyltransferase